MTQANTLSVGDEVLFLLRHGPSKGKIRPAKVISVLGDIADLAVFTNEYVDQTASTVITVAGIKKGTEIGTWHEKGTVLPAQPVVAPAQPAGVAKPTNPATQTAPVAPKAPVDAGLIAATAPSIPKPAPPAPKPAQ